MPVEDQPRYDPRRETGSQSLVVFSFVAFCAAVVPVVALTAAMRLWLPAAWLGVAIALVALALNAVALAKARRAKDTAATLMAATGFAASLAGGLLCLTWLLSAAALISLWAPSCTSLFGC